MREKQEKVKSVSNLTNQGVNTCAEPHVTTNTTIVLARLK